MQYIYIEDATIRSIGNTFGIKPSTLNYYINKGMCKTQAIMYLVNDCYVNILGQLVVPDKYDISKLNSNGNCYIVKGIKFKSQQEALKYFEVNRATVWRKMRDANLNFEKAVEDILDSYVIISGKAYKSISDAARQHNVNEQLLRNRLKRGMNIEDAMGQPVNAKYSKSKISLTVKGKTFESMTECCKFFNIDIQGLSYRLNNGMNVDDAVDDCILYKNTKQSKQLSINGVTYGSISDACRSIGLPVSTVLNRIKNTERAPEEILLEMINSGEYKLRPKVRKRDKSINFRKMCEEAGISYNKAYGRLRNHPEMTEIEVINYYLQRK